MQVNRAGSCIFAQQAVNPVKTRRTFQTDSIPGVLTKTSYRVDIPGIASINVLGKADEKDIKYCQKLAKLLKKEAELARRAGLTVRQTPILILKDIETAVAGDYYKALIGKSDIRNILDKRIRPLLKEFGSYNEKLIKGIIAIKEYDKQAFSLVKKAKSILPGVDLNRFLQEEDLDNLIQNYRPEMTIKEVVQKFPALSFPFGGLGALYDCRTKAIFITPDVYKRDLELDSYHTVLHEYGHSIFESQEKIEALCSYEDDDFLFKEPDVLDQNLHAFFYNRSIDELFADTCAVLTTGGPVAIQRSSEKAESRDFSKNWPLDIWGSKEASEKYEANFGDEHIIFNPVRSFIWKSIKAGKLTPEEVLRGTVTFTIKENENIDTSLKKNIKERNISLIDFLSQNATQANKQKSSFQIACPVI